MSLTDLQTSGGGFKTATEIEVLKIGALGSSTASSVEEFSKVMSGKFSARTLDL